MHRRVILRQEKSVKERIITITIIIRVIRMDFTFCLCGEAGQGLQSIGNILLTALGKSGWDVHAYQDYESRVRGGSNFFQIRVADHTLGTFREEVDLLVALASSAHRQFADKLQAGGIAVHPGPASGMQGEVVADFQNLAETAGGSPKMASAAMAGFVWAFLAADIGALAAELETFFSRRGAQMVTGNLKAAQAGFDLGRRYAERVPEPPRPAGRRLLLRGNDAIALGAMAAGVKYVSAYPMTPATSIVEFIAARAQEAGILVEQAEDEIAAINMALGAAYAGARAMTATSGGGFCLMTEAVGLAGSAEIPVVIVNGQRPGPSTGLPTRTEQGDLLFAIHAGHGDFPRAVLAPATVEDCFYIMGHAFNMAEEYHVPVIVLTDQHLADSFQTIPPLDSEAIEIRRGPLATAARDYRRYSLTDSGVSPRLFPGSEPAVVVIAGDEHDEEGHLIEDAPTRIAMMEKRMAKMRGLRDNALSPRAEGSSTPDLVLITWGSVWGAAREAVENFGEEKVRLLHLPQLWPLPEAKLKALLPPSCPIWTVEGNYSGQLARLLRMHGIDVAGSVRRYDGRPISARQIGDFLREVL